MGFSSLLRKALSTRDERGRKTSDRFRFAVRRAVRDMLYDAVGPVLDAGGGDGILFDPGISSLAGITTVLDFDMDALKEGCAAYRGKGAFLCGDITGMPLRDGLFDVTVCIGTFYNFPSADMVQKGINEMARVTGRDGRVIVEFRNADNPVVAFAYRHAEKYDPSLNGLALNAYTIKDAERFLNRAGLLMKRVKLIGIPIKPLAIGFIVEAVHREKEDIKT
jgi:ubiquinone/menaquinone biosynthesis C-methylase UbiE